MALTHFLPGAATAALVLSWQTPTAAQDNFRLPISQLEQIIVTGARSPEASILASRTERGTLDRRSVQSFEDLGRRVDAGVNFSRQTNSINIGGLDADRVLTTLDGIRLPWLGRDARGVSGGVASFDFDTLSAIDIVRGSDSSTAGSGALAGAVALRTLDPADLLTSGRRFGALGRAGYDGADYSFRLNQALAARMGNTLFLIQGAYRDGHEFENRGEVGGYGATRTEQNPADYDQDSVLLKLVQNIGGEHRIGLTGDHFARDQVTDVRTDQGRTFEVGAKSATERSERQRLSLSYDYAAPPEGAIIDRVEAIVYWQRQGLETGQRGVRTRDPRANIIPRDPFRYGFPSGPYGRNSDLEEDGYGIVGRAVRRLYAGGVSHRLSVGLDAYAATTRQFSNGFDNCPDIPTRLPRPFGPQTCIFLKTNQADLPEADGRALGMYLEHEIALVGGRLRLTPGLRFDSYEQAPQSTAAFEASPAFVGLPPTSGDERLSGKLRGEWDAAEDTVLYAQWAQGFRAPTATELYLRFGGPGSYLRVGSPDLVAETSNGFDVGLRRDNEALGGAISVFSNQYETFIDTVPLDATELGLDPANYPLGITGSVNRDEVRIWGIKARGNWAFAPNWRTWGSLAYTDGEDKTTDRPLNSVAPFRAIVGLGYARTEWGLDASVTAASARDEVERPGVDFAPYQVVDLIAWWAPARAQGARLQAAALNLFDEKTGTP